MRISWYEPISEFPMYGISREGNIVRFPNTKRSRSGGIKRAPVVFLKTQKKKYIEVVLRPSFTAFTRQLHRILAQTYIPNPEGKPQVNHKGGNKYNYSLDNLEWMTGLESVRHAIENGFGRYDKGKSI